MTQTPGDGTDNPAPVEAGQGSDPRVHWLLPVDPAAHPEHLPADWRSRSDATEVWRAVGRSQSPERWCLRSGYRSMRVGDLIWVYLSRRQELCAVGRVRQLGGRAGERFVLVDWDEMRTAALCATPLARGRFRQVPMSTCRARPEVVRLLEAEYEALGGIASAGDAGTDP